MSPRALPLALLCLLAPLPALAAKDPVTVEQGAPPPAQGATVYVEKDGAPIREAPAADGKLVKKMPLGVPVTVQAEAAVPGTLAGEDGHWVRVYSNAEGVGYGWMWSGTLTQARFKQDIDQDGEAEVITVGFNKDDEVVVRVREPKATDPEEASSAINLGLRSDIDGTLTAIEVSFLPAGEAGAPLVQVMWRGREMCASSSWYSYASYTQAGGGGKAQIALAHVGSGADAPIHWSTEAKFDPAAGAVELTERSGGEGEDGKPYEEVKTRRYTFKDGVFVDPSGAATAWQGPPPRAEGAGKGGKAKAKAKAEGGAGGAAKDAAKKAAQEEALKAIKGKKAGGKD